MRPNPHFTADLVTFTVEILNGKLRFLRSDTCIPIPKVPEWIRETYVLEPSIIKFGTLQSQLTQVQSHWSFRVYLGKQSLGFLFSDNFSAFRWKLQSTIATLHLSVYMCTPWKWTFYKNYICRVCEQIIISGGGGGEGHSNCEGGCQKKFSIKFVTWSEHRSLGFYQKQISKNPQLLKVISRTSADVRKWLYCHRIKKNTKYTCTWIYLNIFLSIVYFIWCTLR